MSETSAITPSRTSDGRLRSYSGRHAARDAAISATAAGDRATNETGAGAASAAAAVGQPAVVQLAASYGHLLGELGRVGQDVGNRRSRLKLWMGHRGLDEASAIGPELGAEFESGLRGFKLHLDRRGDTRRSVGESASRMRAVQRIAADLFVVAVHGTTFLQVLAAAVDLSPRPVPEIARQAGMSRFTLRSWLEGRCQPTSRSAAAFPHLERVLNLPPATLADRLAPIGASRDRPITALGRALCEAVHVAGTTLSRAAEDAGVLPNAVYQWVYGHSGPGVVQRERDLPRLEHGLGLEPGALAAHLTPLNLRSLPYHVGLTAAQQAEVDALVRHKTDRSEDREEYRPNTYWKIRVDDRVCATGDRFTRFLQAFYGYLVLPSDADDPLLRGLGRPAGSGTLADLADAPTLIGYLKFRAARSLYGAGIRRARLDRADSEDGEEDATGYNTDTRVTVETVCSLLRPQTGLLWQANAPAVATFPLTNDPDALSAWRARVEDARTRLKAFLKHLADEEQIQATRGFEHIARILELDRPMDVLVTLRDRARLEYENTRRFSSDPVRVAVRLRDFVLIALLCAAPLRKRHWEIMSYRENGTGHLRLVTDPSNADYGHYELVYPKAVFKALADHRKAPYRAKVPRWLTPFIRRYLAEARPLLGGAARCDYVFRPAATGAAAACDGAGTAPTDKPPRPMCIELAVMAVTRRLISEFAPEGMRSHAFRHVIATHLVKRYEFDGLTRAADALHNTIAVVKKHYGHLTSQDRTARSMHILEEEYGQAAPERATDGAAR